jgi:predicted enzyme related to lactoylglutathione lyase
MFNNSVARDAGIAAYAVIDTNDLDRVTQFWCALLGVGVLDVPEVRADRYVTLEPAPSLPGSMKLVFQRVPEAKAGKNRVHVDMFVDDLDAATARIEELGGRSTEPGRTVDEGRWLSRVMADPEGNEFCICLVHPDGVPDRG